MGIRFICETCDRRLNVKSFLAGKKGICPHCGARVRIPQESQIPSSKELRQAQDSSDPLVSVGDVKNNQQTALAKPHATADSDSSAEQVIRVENRQLPEPASEPASPPIFKDPIAEAPDAVWYVRPPSGGQYGPAEGEVMSRWVGEGRVSADSLVWREGWDDWRSAVEEFPSLDPHGPRPNATDSPTPNPEKSDPPTSENSPSTSSESSKSALSAPTRKRDSSVFGVAIVAGLGLLVLVLGIVLIILVTRSGDNKSNDAGQPKDGAAMRPWIQYESAIGPTAKC